MSGGGINMFTVGEVISVYWTSSISIYRDYYPQFFLKR
jgi:hypothetical protein